LGFVLTVITYLKAMLTNTCYLYYSIHIMGVYIKYLTNEILSNVAKCTLATIYTFLYLFFTFIFYFVAWMLLNNHMLHVNVITK